MSLSATTRSTASAADKTVGSRELFRHFGLWIGLAVLALICIAPVQPGLSEAGQRMIGIMLFAVIVWASNAVSYPVSAGVIMALMAMLIGFAPKPDGNALFGTENLGPLSGISAGRSKQPPEILEKISRFLLAFSFFIGYNLCLCNSTLRSCHGFRSFCCEGPA